MMNKSQENRITNNFVLGKSDFQNPGRTPLDSFLFVLLLIDTGAFFCMDTDRTKNDFGTPPANRQTKACSNLAGPF